MIKSLQEQMQSVAKQAAAKIKQMIGSMNLLKL